MPGVIATQHSGTGKANQYFLRGFNLDHGTDFAGFVDGVPVNMLDPRPWAGLSRPQLPASPELVERIDYRKGPYFADVGDFSAAGTVRFKTVDRLDRPIADATVGSRNIARWPPAAVRWATATCWAALDGTLSSGPWDLDENLRKVNGLVKLSRSRATRPISASPAITRHGTPPIRCRAGHRGGLIDRWGTIDPGAGRADDAAGAGEGNATLGETGDQPVRDLL